MYKIIMLPQPILVSEKLTIEEANFISHYQDVDGNFFKIIAGLPDLPKLDLSLIANEIGWVDVEKLANDHIYSMQNRKLSPLILGAKKLSFIDGFKTHQSLNEKKWTNDDLASFAQFISHNDWVYLPSKNYWVNEEQEELEQKLSSQQLIDIWLQQRKPKEYLVEVEMQTLYFDGTRWVDSLPKKFIDKLVKTKVSPKITNNTIKILKIC